MFERFTQRARAVVVAADTEARELRHSYVGTEHLLLGLLAEGEGMAGVVLGELGIELEWAREWVGRTVGHGEEIPAGQIPMTPRAKKILELSLREALSLGHNFVGTEHILLGLVSSGSDATGEGVAVRMLAERGAHRIRVRDAVIRALSGGVAGDPAPSEPYREGTPTIHFEGAPPPRPTRRRCEQAFTLHGALFLCQKARGHSDEHVEHGDGWTMTWTSA